MTNTAEKSERGVSHFKAPQERGGSLGNRVVRPLRVFVRRTAATPDDELAFIGLPPFASMIPAACQVHVSCVFTWDIERAVQLAMAWNTYFPGKVFLGGPAIRPDRYLEISPEIGLEFDPKPGDFVPGMYMKKGYVITTRGCPNKCPWCFVPKREGAFRTVPITEGFNVADNNILAAPMDHLMKVFYMLGRQSRAAEFTGGLDVSLLNKGHIALLKSIRVARIFLAYDDPDELTDLIRAAGMLRAAGFDKEKLACYVLVGGGDDTVAAAEHRLTTVWRLGLTPFAMLFQGGGAKKTRYSKEWRDLARNWTRPAIINARMGSHDPFS